jgi:hypothetical protein
LRTSSGKRPPSVERLTSSKNRPNKPGATGWPGLSTWIVIFASAILEAAAASNGRSRSSFTFVGERIR